MANNVVKGNPILASDMNSKVDNDTLVEFGRAVDAKFQNVIFVGTNAQWLDLSLEERRKYIMRGIPL